MGVVMHHRTNTHTLTHAQQEFTLSTCLKTVHLFARFHYQSLCRTPPCTHTHTHTHASFSHETYVTFSDIEVKGRFLFSCWVTTRRAQACGVSDHMAPVQRSGSFAWLSSRYASISRCLRVMWGESPSNLPCIRLTFSLIVCLLK